MGNDKKAENIGKETKNALITIVSVFMYIAYRLITGFAKGVKRFKKSEVSSIIGAIILIVLAIVFWPVTFAASGVLLVLAFLLISYGIIDM